MGIARCAGTEASKSPIKPIQGMNVSPPGLGDNFNGAGSPHR